MCCPLPIPAEPQLSPLGLALARAITSAVLRMGERGFTERTTGIITAW
jgi:hypothetical protein